MTAVIREIQISDAAQMVELKLALASETPFMLREPEEVERDAEEEASQIAAITQGKTPCTWSYVAEQEGQIVGWMVFSHYLRRRNRHVGTFVIGVRQSAWGTGVSKTLMQQMLEVAREQNVRRIEMEVVEENVRGRGLYEQFGFKVEGVKIGDHCIEGNRYVNSLVMAKQML